MFIEVTKLQSVCKEWDHCILVNTIGIGISSLKFTQSTCKVISTENKTLDMIKGTTTNVLNIIAL